MSIFNDDLTLDPDDLALLEQIGDEATVHPDDSDLPPYDDESAGGDEDEGSKG